MKTFVLTAMLAMFSLLASAQLVATSITQEGNTRKVTILNSYSCLAKFDYKYTVGSGAEVKVVDVSIQSNQSISIIVTGQGEIKFQVHTKDSCVPSNGTGNGWRELPIQHYIPVVLPVKWVQQPKVKWLSKREAEVSYEVGEVTNVKQFRIQASHDAINWFDITIQFPDEIQPNRLYTTKIKF